MAKLDYRNIEKSPDRCDGQAVVAGTDIRVSWIVAGHRHGWSATEMVERYPRLRLADVYDALAYAEDHPDEVAAAIAADERRAAEYRVVLPPLIEKAIETFRRELPGLMKTHYMKWVAYHGDQRIGFGRTQTELYQKCFRMGLTEEEFLVCQVCPPPPDEIDPEELWDD